MAPSVACACSMQKILSNIVNSANSQTFTHIYKYFQIKLYHAEIFLNLLRSFYFVKVYKPFPTLLL